MPTPAPVPPDHSLEQRWSTALVVIARNAQPTLGRLLDSARPWVDAMVVVDTGSSDRTADIARACGARVGHFAWIDDFAAARNASLDLAGADWHVIMDADEWLTEGGPTIAALRATPPQFVGRLRQDNSTTAGGVRAIAPCWVSRILPGPVRYEGRVHEQPMHDWMVRDLPIAVGHDGYEAQALLAKAGRNAQLLRQMLTETPDDPYLLYQLGKDHDVQQQYDVAARCFAEARARLASPHRQAQRSPAWLHDLLAREVHALKQLGRHQQAVELAQESLQTWQHSPDLHFAMGDAMLDWAARQPHLAQQLLPAMEHAWLRCLHLGDRPELAGTVIGRGSHLAAHNLALLYDVLGRPQDAQRMRVLARAANP